MTNLGIACVSNIPLKIKAKLLTGACYTMPPSSLYGLQRKFSNQVVNHDIN